MKNSMVGNIFLIIYGIALFLRISLMESAERDGFDVFQWVLGVILAVVSGYRVVQQLKKNKETSN